MTEASDKIYRNLRIGFYSFFSVGILCYIATTAFKLKEIFQGGSSSVVFERYGILLTLIGVPFALKIFSYLSKKNSVGNLRKYSFAYYLRLCLLFSILVFNIIGLSLFGSKNLFLLAFVILVSFLFCLPNKTEILTLCELTDEILSNHRDEKH